MGPLLGKQSPGFKNTNMSFNSDSSSLTTDMNQYCRSEKMEANLENNERLKDHTDTQPHFGSFAETVEEYGVKESIEAQEMKKNVSIGMLSN